MEVAALIVDRHLHLLQKRDVKDLARAAQITPAEAHAGIEFIRTLDPRPGRLYNREQTRLIEPDVVFIKRGGEWIVSMNEENLPSLRLSARYRRMAVEEARIIQLQHREIDSRGDGQDRCRHLVARSIRLNLHLAGIQHGMRVGQDAFAFDHHAGGSGILPG